MSRGGGDDREPDTGTPATGRVVRIPHPASDEGEATTGTPATGWVAPWSGGSGWEPDSGTPATGRLRFPSPGSEDVTPATGWVVAGSPAPAEDTSTPPAPSPAAGLPPGSGWPERPALGWAQEPARVAEGPAAPPAWGSPATWPLTRRRRLAVALGLALLIVLLIVGGVAGFVAGVRPTPAPSPANRLQPTRGPLGAVDSPLISFNLPAGWEEQQQSATDVRLAHLPNGSMDIHVESTGAAGGSTPAAVLQEAQLRIVGAAGTTGGVTTCVAPTTRVIAGRFGQEQGFQWKERGVDGKTLFTNCEVDWASVQNGKVYVWETFDTLANLRAATTAANQMQRSARWHE